MWCQFVKKDSVLNSVIDFLELHYIIVIESYVTQEELHIDSL